MKTFKHGHFWIWGGQIWAHKSGVSDIIKILEVKDCTGTIPESCESDKCTYRKIITYESLAGTTKGMKRDTCLDNRTLGILKDFYNLQST